MRRRELSRHKGAARARGFQQRLGRLAVVVLAGGLGVFTFADGLHSVHHLPDHNAASRCAVAAASANVVGATPDLIPIALPPLPRLADREKGKPAAPGLQPVWTEQGRAPPISQS